MSELIQKNDNRATIRWKLLTGVSALALTAYVSSANLAKAEDADQPQIWIELGGQLSGLDDGQEAFSPAIMAARPSMFTPSQKYERPPLYSIDEDGKISFQPEDSNWIFSASVRYGRSIEPRCTIISRLIRNRFSNITPSLPSTTQLRPHRWPRKWPIPFHGRASAI